MHPDVEVIGLDHCPLCVATARTLARRLDVTNTHFRLAEVEDVENVFPGERFDVVLARSFFSCGRHRGSDDRSSTFDKVTTVLPRLRAVLTPNTGRFISTETCNGTADVWHRASTIAGESFEIDWSTSRGITVGGPQSVVRWAMLAARPTDGPTYVSLQDALALLVDAELNDRFDVPRLTGSLAEAVFDLIKDRTFIFGSQAQRPGMVLRRELYRVGASVASMDFTDKGARELVFWPRSAAASLVMQLKQEAEELIQAGILVQRFVPQAVNEDRPEGVPS
jgi:hypothetical protein